MADESIPADILKIIPHHCCPKNSGCENLKRLDDLTFRWLLSVRDMDFALIFQGVAHQDWLCAFAAEAAPTKYSCGLE